MTIDQIVAQLGHIYAQNRGTIDRVLGFGGAGGGGWLLGKLGRGVHRRRYRRY